MLVARSRLVHAPIDLAWQELSDLGRIHEWLTTIDSSHSERLALGARRHVHFAKPAFGRDGMDEVVTEVGERSFRYDIDGGLGPFRVWRNGWRLEPVDDDSCRLTVESEVTLGGLGVLLRPVAGISLRRLVDNMMADFARHVEALALRVES